MRKDITITAEGRDARGKNEARRLRAKGSMPAVVYGGSEGATPVAISPKELSRILNSKTGHTTIFDVAVQGGETSPVRSVDWQRDPIKDNQLHIDQKRIDAVGLVFPRSFLILIQLIAQIQTSQKDPFGGIKFVLLRFSWMM